MTSSPFYSNTEIVVKCGKEINPYSETYNVGVYTEKIHPTKRIFHAK